VTKLIFSLLLEREKAEETNHSESEKGEKTGQVNGWKTRNLAGKDENTKGRNRLKDLSFPYSR
jgi:hypothetical protein